MWQNNIKPLINRLPILGISTGHQVLRCALGAKITKLKLGHRGVNYPMHNPASYKGEITVQNHSYVVDADSLNKIKDLKITGFNLNDRTVEEIESKKLKIIGMQYYPVSPGFNEVNAVFKRFIKMYRRRYDMPRRKDIKKVLMIGSGPIIIGQACEFDYSGSQACKALREEGYFTILVNSNPATIMTDPGMADVTYIEPLDGGDGH